MANQRNGYVRALVVRAVFGNFFRAGAQAGHRHQYFQMMAVHAVGHFTAQGDIVIQQRLNAGNRRRFLAEIGEADADAAGIGIQQFQHFLGEVFQLVEVQRAVLGFHQRHKARHMGAFLIGGQAHGHGEAGHGGLDAGSGFQADGETQIFDADLINRHISQVFAALHIGDGVHAG